MDALNKLKLSIYETHNAGLIDDETMTEMVSVCESADMEDTDDRKEIGKIVDKLISLNESTESMEKQSIINEIHESVNSGDITEEERDILLNML